MSTLHWQIIYWRDIPAQVIVKKSRREQVKLELAEAFAQAIDMAAMRADLHQDEAYLEHWVKSDLMPIEPEGEETMQQIARKLADQLEADYPKERLKELIKNGGVK